MTLISTSTSAFYERSTQDMAALRARAEDLNTRMTRGERLSRSSDDPVAASRLRALARAGTLSDIDKANANRASADLTLADAALSSFADTITRVRTLAMQAANETLSDDQRASIGAELKELHANLVTLANSRDSAGHALFGGEAAGQAYTLDGAGNAVYVGTPAAGDLSLGEGQTVTRGVTGPEFLDFSVNGSPTDLLAVVKQLGDALTGGADPAQAARDSLDGLTAGLDKLTASQTLVGSRLAWIDLTTERRTDLGELRANEQADIGGTDIATTVANLQQMMLVLEASQAAFSKLSGLSLFNQLR